MSHLDGFKKAPMPCPEVRKILSDGGQVHHTICKEFQEIRYTPYQLNTCYVIVTSRSILWTFLTLATTGLLAVSVMTPQWLVSREKHLGIFTFDDSVNVTQRERQTWETIGIFNGCTAVRVEGTPTSFNCDTYVTGFDMPTEEFPDVWKSALILLSAAVILMTFTGFTSVFSICIQAIFRKSIFTVSGLIQSIAALLLVLGQLLYIAGWGSQKIKNMCGEQSGPFLLDDCSIGLSFYACLSGTALVFACALLSIQAENATSTDDVERKILSGKLCICCP